MRIIFNNDEMDIPFHENGSIEELMALVTTEPVYLVACQKRFVSSRQLYESPCVKTAMRNANLKVKEPSSFFEMLDMELDGERDVWEAMGVRLPVGVAAHPYYYRASSGQSFRESRTVSEYLPLQYVAAFTLDRLPSDVYLPTQYVEPFRRPKGYVPSRCNFSIDFSRFDLSHVEKTKTGIKYENVEFHEDGSMILEWSAETQRAVERINRLVQFGAPCRKTIYDRVIFGMGGVDWIETFDAPESGRKSVAFKHVDARIRYQRMWRVDPDMSPFLACVASTLGVTVGTLKDRLVSRVKAETFQAYNRGALLHFFGTVQVPPREDFIAYLRRDDRVDYTFVWEIISRPGIFKKGVNLVVYDADREVFIFPTKEFSGVGFQNDAPVLSMVKEGDFFSPIKISSSVDVKSMMDSPICHGVFDRTARKQVVFNGKTLGVEKECLVPCLPRDPDDVMEQVDYADVKMLPPSDTVAYLQSVGAKPRYCYVVDDRCVGIWTEGMHFVPCLEGAAVLPETELFVYKKFKNLKGVDPERLQRSRRRLFEEEQFDLYKKLADKKDVVEIDMFCSEKRYFHHKLIVLKTFEERLRFENAHVRPL
jgi:hypothetical protein